MIGRKSQVLDNTTSSRTRLGVYAALRSELIKLAAQRKVRATLIACVIAPMLITLVLDGQDRPPKDTMYGRHLHTSGYAVALFILSFASQWALPAIASIVAGDIFASEDHLGTWKTILTRSMSRSQLFIAKCAAAAGFAVVATTLLGTSTILSGTVVIGRQPLPGLSGQLIASNRAFALVSAAWASILLPTLVFVAIAMLVSVASRSPSGGIAGTIVIGLVTQILGWLGGMDILRRFLPTTAFDAWHGLLTRRPYLDLFYEGAAISVAWIALCVVLAHRMLRNRDITGG